MLINMNHFLKQIFYFRSYSLFICYIIISFLSVHCLAQKSKPLKDLQLEMNLISKDSVKYLEFFAYQPNFNNHKTPVKININVYVLRTFSELKIGETKTNAFGYGEIELPSGIPGDSTGNLLIIGRVEENKVFGTVEISKTIQCGIPVNYHVAKYHRALWTTIAPIWMIVTLTILLIGVWIHFIYVLFKLHYIRRESK